MRLLAWYKMLSGFDSGWVVVLFPEGDDLPAKWGWERAKWLDQPKQEMDNEAQNG